MIELKRIHIKDIEAQNHIICGDSGLIDEQNYNKNFLSESSNYLIRKGSIVTISRVQVHWTGWAFIQNDTNEFKQINEKNVDEIYEIIIDGSNDSKKETDKEVIIL